MITARVEYARQTAERCHVPFVIEVIECRFLPKQSYYNNKYVKLMLCTKLGLNDSSTAPYKCGKETAQVL